MTPEARALLSTAARAFQEQRMADAVAGYRALLAVEPGLPNSWFNLAVAQRATGDSAAALASLDRALAEGLEGPEEAHLNRALILLEDRHDAAGARTALETALALAPDYVPAWLNLGNLEEDLGDRAAAAAAYARSREIDPVEPLALARAIGVAEDASPLFEAARERLADPGLAPLSRADIGFALAGALDRAGAWDEAFAAAERANAAAREVNAAHGARYDPAMVDALVNALIAMPTIPTIAADGQAPVFVCGSFRSGSTLIEQVLARHTDLYSAGELGALGALAATLSPFPNAITQLSPERVEEMRGRYASAAAAIVPGGRRHIDKRPDNIFLVPLILRLFPDARIVCTTRDARDLAVSLWFLHAGPPMPYATDLPAIVHRTGAVARLADHWAATYPGAVHVVDYDRLIAAPEAEIAALVAFVGAERTAAEAPELVRTASNWQVRRPLYATSSGRWRHYAAQLAAAGVAGTAGA
jgi:tetratricopeptide (TPR) repeat protein